MKRKPRTVAENREPQAKARYREPELIIYGGIREITTNVGPKGALDGGGGAAAGPKTGQ